MKIIPDQQALKMVEKVHAGSSDSEKYRLAQADTLLRLAKAEDMDEVFRMAEAGLLDDLIADHNSRQSRNC